MEQYKKVVDEGLQTDLNITADCLAEIQKNKMELKEEYKNLLKYSHKYKFNLRKIISLSIIIVMLCVGSVFVGQIIKDTNSHKKFTDDFKLTVDEKKYIDSFGCRLHENFTFEIGNIKKLKINLYSAYFVNDVYYFIDVNLIEKVDYKILLNGVEYKEGITMFLKTNDFTSGKNKINIIVTADGIEYVYNLTI